MRYLAFALLLLLPACATTYAGGEPIYENGVY